MLQGRLVVLSGIQNMQNGSIHRKITILSPLSHHSRTTLAPLSHHSLTTLSPLSHHSLTTLSPLSHHSLITLSSLCSLTHSYIRLVVRVGRLHREVRDLNTTLIHTHGLHCGMVLRETGEVFDPRRLPIWDGLIAREMQKQARFVGRKTIKQ